MKELGTKIWYVWVFFCQTVCFNLMNRNNFLFCFLGYRREKRPTYWEKYLLCWNTNDEECCTCIENIPGYNIFALFMLRMLTKKITWFQWGARPSCPSVGHIFREWSIAFLLWRMAPKEKEKKGIDTKVWLIVWWSLAFWFAMHLSIVYQHATHGRQLLHSSPCPFRPILELEQNAPLNVFHGKK